MRQFEDLQPDISDDYDGPSGIVIGLLTVATLVAWGCAITAATRAPWVRDLYNLVYHHHRPARGESTALFLFGFPTALTAEFVMMGLRLFGSWQPRRNVPAWLVTPILLLWTAVFFLGSVHRSWLIYTHAY